MHLRLSFISKQPIYADLRLLVYERPQIVVKLAVKPFDPSLFSFFLQKGADTEGTSFQGQKEGAQYPLHYKPLVYHQS